MDVNDKDWRIEMEYDFRSHPTVVVFGNLAEGHHIVGPFVGWNAAAEYAEDYDEDWGHFIMPLQSPEGL